MVKRLYLILILISSLYVTAFSQTERASNHSLQLLGMGGAGVAVPTSQNPLFQNPAILSYVRNSRVTLPGLKLRFNQQTYDHYNFYKDNEEKFENMDDLSDSEQNAFFSDILKEAQKPANAYINANVQWIGPGMGLGVYSEGRTEISVFGGASGLPIVDMSWHGESVIAFGYSTSFVGLLPRSLQVGFTLKRMNRWASHKIKTITGLSENEEFETYRSSVFSFDMGAMYSITRRFIFGMAIYDVNSPRFNWETDTANPISKPSANKLDASMRFGVAYYPKWGRQGIMRNLGLAFDVDQLFDSDITFFRKIYMGAEARLMNVFRARTGFYQGYPSFGAGIDLRFLQFDFALYGEEIGKYAGDVVSWNRAFSLTLGF